MESNKRKKFDILFSKYDLFHLARSNIWIPPQLFYFRSLELLSAHKGNQHIEDIRRVGQASIFSDIVLWGLLQHCHAQIRPVRTSRWTGTTRPKASVSVSDS